MALNAESMFSLPLAHQFEDDSDSTAIKEYTTFPIEVTAWHDFEQLVSSAVHPELQLHANDSLFSCLLPNARLQSVGENDVNFAVSAYCLQRVQLLLDQQLACESTVGFRFRIDPVPPPVPGELPTKLNAA
jgi:hypothetical protein